MNNFDRELTFERLQAVQGKPWAELDLDDKFLICRKNIGIAYALDDWKNLQRWVQIYTTTIRRGK